MLTKANRKYNPTKKEIGLYYSKIVQHIVYQKIQEKNFSAYIRNFFKKKENKKEEKKRKRKRGYGGKSPKKTRKR